MDSDCSLHRRISNWCISTSPLLRVQSILESTVSETRGGCGGGFEDLEFRERRKVRREKIEG
ncbi:hypothetical protein A2U01_0086887, partial [Trifolium medium]|nr:hypothetical protein [Trifolium medium]